jgi:alkanesulfonate monooxygenase SsuD/methylene tetrahydromethanopterin reductase-like flavin-dependent oxidoreductase (luciferase family)
MKVGVLQFFSWPGRHGPLEDVFARALERIEIMDRGGFDAVWLAEHHFTTFSVCPSVHMLGTLAAARTKRLRIGTAVSLAALYHPLRLAEEVALLDMLSGGRVNWGAGRGFAHSEFNAFGIPPEESTERFHEAVDIVLQAWTQEKLTFAGKHFSFDNVEVMPKPLQKPHPPVWMAATSEAAVDWAASRGFSILMDPHASIAELGSKRRRYTERMAAAGFSDAGRDIPMARLIALASTTAEAETIARRGAQWLVDAYAGPQHQTQKTMQMTRTFGGKEPVQYYIDDVIIHGTPGSVVDQIARLREEIGLNYLMCAPLSRDTFRLLADKVVPQLLTR